MNRAASVPAVSELFNPTLAALHKLGGSGSINEIASQVIAGLKLPQQVVELAHGTGNQTELEYRLAWARTYLKKFGFLENSDRGVWSLTSAGRLGGEVEPREVVEVARASVQQGARGPRRRRSGAPTSDTGVLPSQDETQAETAPWRETLIDALLRLSPDSFERLCQRLLRESGFIEVEVTGRAGDGGIDGRGIIRVGGLISFPVLFQAKRHSGTIGANVVRDFRGAMMGRSDKGLIITTGAFTGDAWKEATRDGAPPIDLIDGQVLVERLKGLKLGVRIKSVEAIEIDQEWLEKI